jgi:hypothetical protein
MRQGIIGSVPVKSFAVMLFQKGEPGYCWRRNWNTVVELLNQIQKNWPVAWKDEEKGKRLGIACEYRSVRFAATVLVALIGTA